MHARRRFVDALSILSSKELTQEEILQLQEANGITLIGEIYHADYTGTELEMISVILGHASTQTTRIYANPSVEMLRNVMMFRILLFRMKHQNGQRMSQNLPVSVC